jgi:hypothetical protein
MTAERPRRVQRRRAKGWRMPANTAQVDRSTLFANPFSVKEDGHDRAVAMHRAWLTGRSIGKVSLRGKNLACWSPLPEYGEPDNCHLAHL